MKQATSLGAAVLLTLGGLLGCTSYTTMHTARPIPENAMEFSVASGVIGSFDTAERESNGVMPTVAEAQLRVGVSERMDAGVRAFVTGFLFDINYMFLDLGPVAASINPALGGLFLTDPEDPESGDGWGYLTGWLALLIDLLSVETTTVTVGPRVGFVSAYDNRGDDDSNVSTTEAQVGLVGGMIGIRQQLTDRVSVMPEASLYMMNLNSREPMYSASLTFSFAQ